MRLTSITLTLLLAFPVSVYGNRAKVTRRHCLIGLGGLATGVGIWQGRYWWRGRQNRAAIERLIEKVVPPAQVSLRKYLLSIQDNEAELTQAVDDLQANFLRLNELRKRPYGQEYFLATAKLIYEPPGSILAELPHIGYNLVLDIPTLERRLKSEELATLKNSTQDPVAAAALLQRLMNRFSRPHIGYVDFPEEKTYPIDVATVLFGEVPIATECRHHALIIASILKHYGFEGEIRMGWAYGGEGPRSPSGNHIWLELTGTDMFVDATNFDRPLPRNEFHKIIESYFDNGKIVRP